MPFDYKKEYKEFYMPKKYALDRDTPKNELYCGSRTW